VTADEDEAMEHFKSQTVINSKQHFQNQEKVVTHIEKLENGLF